MNEVYEWLKLKDFIKSLSLSSTEQEKKTAEESLTSDEIREMCKMWETVQNFVEKHHLNKAVAVQAMNLFNDNAMSHFREILKRRQKYVSLDRFLVKVARKEKDCIEPVHSSDSVSDSESHPTKLCTLPHVLYISLISSEVRDSSTFVSSSSTDETQT